MKSATTKKETKKKECIRILIADDHSVVREGLVSLVKRKPDMTVVAEASNGREAVDLWKEHRPDVILLDLRMPELDGVGRHELGTKCWVPCFRGRDCSDIDHRSPPRKHAYP